MRALIRKMSQPLIGVKNLQGQDISPAPVINTEIVVPPVTECSVITSGAKTANSKDIFLQTYKLREAGNDSSLRQFDLKKNLENFYNSLVSNGVDQRLNIDFSESSSTDSNRFIYSYLTNLSSQSLPRLRLVDSCMKELSQFDFDALEKQKQITDESKLRLESVKDPETKVSYYEGWFPLFRPMAEPALFGIFVTSVFLLLLSIGVFLRMSGIQFSISLPTLFLDTGGVDVKKYVYIGLGIGAAAGLGIYGYEKGWFNKLQK